MQKQDIPHLLVEELIAIAQQQTGLSDWGGNDEFKEGLNMLLDACLTEGDLSHIGVEWLKKQCVHHLSNRLEIEETLKQHPEILEVKIERPLFIVAFPRSGSTYLQNLISSNSGVRSPLFWEMWKPYPPPEAATRKVDARIEQLEQLYNGPRDKRLPGGATGNNAEPRAEEVQECFVLLRNSFTSLDYTYEYIIPSYQKWISQNNLMGCYQYFKKQLQILQWHSPGKPWVLKCADHIVDIPSLMNVFPDASIVHLHRHPIKMIQSFCHLQKAMVDIWRKTPISPSILGELCQKRYDLLIRLIIEHSNQRKKTNQFYDLHYTDLVKAPIETVQKIFDYFDYDLGDAGIKEMQAFLNKTRKPNNSYNLEIYSLDAQKINARYATYLEQYIYPNQ